MKNKTNTPVLIGIYAAMMLIGIIVMFILMFMNNESGTALRDDLYLNIIQAILLGYASVMLIHMKKIGAELTLLVGAVMIIISGIQSGFSLWDVIYLLIYALPFIYYKQMGSPSLLSFRKNP